MKFSVKDYGAVGNGVAKDTEAIQKAIAACSAAGGGEVVFDNGCYISGTLELLDGVTLHLEKGAVLKASSDLKDFINLPLPSCDVGERIGFIYAIGKRDIGFAGEGVMDFSSEAFFNDERMPFPGQQDPLTPEQAAEATLAIKPRMNQPICIHDSENVRFVDVRMINSPCWTVSMVNCHHVIVDRVTVDNSLLVPNSDGLGFSESTDVTVSNCHISCADDCLTFCGTQQATVTNCVLRSRSTAIRIGYIANDTRNVVISNIVIHDCNRAIILQGSRKSRIYNILIQNVILHTRLFQGAWWGSGEPLTLVTQGDGEIHNVMMTNVRAESAHGIAMQAHAPGKITDVVLKDWQLTITGEGESPYNRFIDLRDEPVVELPEGRMPWYYAANVERLTVKDIAVDQTGAAADWNITPMVR